MKSNIMSYQNRLKEFFNVCESMQVSDYDGNIMTTSDGINKILDMIETVKSSKNSIYVIGNGGSAAIAGHAVTDFVNVGKLKAYTLHDSPLLSCMANDYGYENSFSETLSHLANKDDILLVISSSGASKNVCNAANHMRKIGGRVITLSGFKETNLLKKTGHVNIWLNSEDYGIVEVGHQFILHNISDRIGQSLKVAC